MSKENIPSISSGATRWRVFVTWAQTVMGIAFMGALIAVALHLVGFHWGVGFAVLGITAVLPIVSFFFSAGIIRHLTRCAPPDPQDPDHMRVVRIVDALYPKTGLPKKPEVLISPIPIPNAFATGRSPRNAFIAVTEGLFFADLTDAELEAVLAHELAHVKNRDTAITAMLSVMGSIFSLLLAAGLPWVFKPAFVSKSDAPLLNKLSRKVEQKKRFLVPTGGFLGFVLMLVLFYIVSIFTKMITLFVSRTRESAADAYSALWTQNPCALSTALQKIIVSELLNGSNIRMMLLTRGLAPILLVNTFADNGTDDEPVSFKERLRRWWRGLGQNHPPVAVRMRQLEKMSGGTCPRIF